MNQTENRIPPADPRGGYIHWWARADPADIALLTTASSRLMNAEGRERGRRQRQKGRTEEAKRKQLPAVDLDEEFVLDDQ